MIPDKIFSIKNVPVSCMIISIISLLGFISHPDQSVLFQSFTITFLIGITAFTVEIIWRKYEADKQAEGEKVKLRREKERTKQKEKTHAQRLDAENLKTQREALRNQRMQTKKETTIIDNVSKFIRGW